MSRVVFQYSRLKRRVPRRTRGVAESLYGRSLSNEGNGFDRVPIPGSEHLVREAGTAPLYLHSPRGAREPARKGADMGILAVDRARIGTITGRHFARSQADPTFAALWEAL